MRQLKWLFIFVHMTILLHSKACLIFLLKGIFAHVRRPSNLRKNIGNPKLQKPTLCSYRSSIQPTINIPVASLSKLCIACAGLQAVLWVPLCIVPEQHKGDWTPKSCNSSQCLLQWLLHVMTKKTKPHRATIQIKQVRMMLIKFTRRHSARLKCWHQQQQDFN